MTGRAGRNGQEWISRTGREKWSGMDKQGEREELDTHGNSRGIQFSLSEKSNMSGSFGSSGHSVCRTG